MRAQQLSTRNYASGLSSVAPQISHGEGASVSSTTPMRAPQPGHSYIPAGYFTGGGGSMLRTVGSWPAYWRLPQLSAL